MASTHASGLPPNFILTPQQQNLLYRALASNQSANGSPAQGAPSMSPTSLAQSPHQNGLGSLNGLQESPYLDYDYDFAPDGNFDFDLGNGQMQKMIGDLPGSTEANSKAGSPDNDGTDKRSHPDEDGEEENGNKRHEGEGKVPKKPGRKPLTNEPSSKRKAQNRAAQRAFRERKEQHLKDLETKVQELEKTSHSATAENSQLRAQMEKMTKELNEYKKRMSLLNTSPAAAGDSRPPVFGHNLVKNMDDVNFQFEFPKFGALPGPEGIAPADGTKQSPTYSPTTNLNANAQSTLPDKSKDKTSPDSGKARENSDGQSRDKVPSTYNSHYEQYGSGASRTSLDSTSYSVNGTNSDGSPSSSHAGASSSCGTSPEPITQSPLGFKPVDTLTTIGEEQQGLPAEDNNQLTNFGSVDFSNFDWLTQQNGGQFDPQLFGGYREPQDNIIANTFDDSFFNEAFDADFSTPYNMATAATAPKKDLCAEIDARKENEDNIVSLNGKLLTCDKMWEKLQNCPKVQSGDIDLDSLCSDLQKKAKCGGSSAVVDEQDFKAVITKHLGDNACTSNL